MGKHFLRLVILCSVCGSFILCNNSVRYYDVSAWNNETIPLLTDSNYYQKMIGYFENKLKLKRIDGRDNVSFRLRVWSFPAFSDPKMIDIDLLSKSPSAKEFSSIGKGKYKRIAIDPKSGWSKFVEKMNKFEIGSVAAKNIEYTGNDGDMLIIEMLRNKKYYLIYTSMEILDRGGAIWERKLVQILDEDFTIRREH